MMIEAKITRTRVLPWEKEEDLWGIEINYSDKHRTAYRVGARAAAEAEIIRLRTDLQYAAKVRGR